MKNALITIALLGSGMTIAGCEAELATGPIGSDFAQLEREGTPVGDPSITPYEAGDPAQFQIWIKPPPTPEELRQRRGTTGQTENATADQTRQQPPQEEIGPADKNAIP